MNGPVVVLGDANVDLALDLPDRSAPAGERRVTDARQTGGGTAGNTAAALARLGVPVEFVGAIGDDGFGRWLADDFARCGVGTRGLIVVPEAPTPQVIALLEPDGERYLVCWPADLGALAWLRPEAVDPELIDGAAWLHTTGMCLRHAPIRDAVLAAMRMARRSGVPVSIDLNLRVELWGLDEAMRVTVMEAVGLADVVLGSGPEELVPLTGEDAPGDAAAALAAGTRTVVARLGSAGALAALPDGRVVEAPGFRVATRSTVGAGDAFNGGFIAARASGRTVEAALEWGNAVAALKVGRGGGARDLPGRDEVVALLGGPGSA